MSVRFRSPTVRGNQMVMGGLHRRSWDHTCRAARAQTLGPRPGSLFLRFGSTPNPAAATLWLHYRKLLMTQGRFNDLLRDRNHFVYWNWSSIRRSLSPIVGLNTSGPISSGGANKPAPLLALRAGSSIRGLRGGDRWQRRTRGRRLICFAALVMMMMMVVPAGTGLSQLLERR